MTEALTPEESQRVLGLLNELCQHPDAWGDAEDYWPSLVSKLERIANPLQTIEHTPMSNAGAVVAQPVDKRR